jgi:hypothetical protein
VWTIQKSQTPSFGCGSRWGFLDNATFFVSGSFTPRAEKIAREVMTRLTQAGFKTYLTPVADSTAASPADCRTDPTNGTVSCVRVETMTNSIIYYPDSAGKVKEIQELLAPVVQFRDARELKVPQLPTPPPTVKIPSPAPIPPQSLTRTIRIVLVDEK